MTMYLLKAPNTLKAALSLPSSKSISNRTLILNALCHHPKPITNLSVCDDTEAVIRALGKKTGMIDVGAAGTAMRFLTAYLAGQQGNYLITGTERMKNRPVQILVDALRAVGAQIEYVEKEGFPPLHVKGRILKGGEIELDGSVSSQYVSALLMAAPAMTNGLRLHLTGQISSRPYIDITVQLMRQFGVAVFEEGQTFTIPPQPYASPDNFTVESDWSAASYWYETVALFKGKEASVSLAGLRPDSLQGDASIAALFDLLGVKTTFTSSGVTLTKKQQTHNGLLRFDFSSMPDMAQTVAVTCAMLHTPFILTGLHTLKIKETDRLCALKTELRKLGYLLEIRNDHTLEWNGKKCKAEDSPVIATYKDHRMAMAFAPAAICMGNGIHIADPEVVSKSYPAFWDDLQKADFVITKREAPDSQFAKRDCCGQHEICEREGMKKAGAIKIEYFDDEELDLYSGIASDSHTEKAIEEFSEVLYTLQPKEVGDWLRSLQLRNVRLPDRLKDEAFLMVEAQRDNK